MSRRKMIRDEKVTLTKEEVDSIMISQMNSFSLSAMMSRYDRSVRFAHLYGGRSEKPCPLNLHDLDIKQVLCYAHSLVFIGCPIGSVGMFSREAQRRLITCVDFVKEFIPDGLDEQRLRDALFVRPLCCRLAPKDLLEVWSTVAPKHHHLCRTSCCNCGQTLFCVTIKKMLFYCVHCLSHDVPRELKIMSAGGTT